MEARTNRVAERTGWRAADPLWELGKVPSVGPPALARAQEERKTATKKNRRLTDAPSERIGRRRPQSVQGLEKFTGVPSKGWIVSALSTSVTPVATCAMGSFGPVTRGRHSRA